MRELILNNGIKTCIKQNSNTPRIALTLNFSINKAENFAGEYMLLNRLLTEGTTKYSAEELATILDENAIELYTEMKYDYLRFRFVCLNEDFELALSILTDIIENSTFNDFEKERLKLKGELEAELDSAKVKVSDLFCKNIYANHFYGHSLTSTLDEVDKTTQDDIIKHYEYIRKNSVKVLAIVGDIDAEKAKILLNKYIGTIHPSVQSIEKICCPNKITKQKYVDLIQEDAQQAQIIQGWQVETITGKDYPSLMLLNVILGASGLSSRLFLELREKKGLAYTVRSSYEIRKQSAVFNIYIGTAPINIETSIQGFKTEIDKVKKELISEAELNNAKNNLIGKQQFITETNSQQANLMAFYAISGLPFDYQQAAIEDFKNVTIEDIKNCANKYFTDNYVIAIIKP